MMAFVLAFALMGATADLQAGPGVCELRVGQTDSNAHPISLQKLKVGLKQRLIPGKSASSWLHSNTEEQDFRFTKGEDLVLYFTGLQLTDHSRAGDTIRKTVLLLTMPMTAVNDGGKTAGKPIELSGPSIQAFMSWEYDVLHTLQGGKLTLHDRKISANGALRLQADLDLTLMEHTPNGPTVPPILVHVKGRCLINGFPQPRKK